MIVLLYTFFNISYFPTSLDFGALQALLSIVNLPPEWGSCRDLGCHDLHVSVVISPVAVMISPVAIVISPGHCCLARCACLAIIILPIVLTWPSLSYPLCSPGCHHLVWR